MDRLRRRAYVALAFWLGIGAGAVFLIALGGGTGAPRPRPAALRGERAREPLAPVTAFARVILLASGLPSRSPWRSQTARTRRARGTGGHHADQERRRSAASVRAGSCATCHTLAAAAAVGHVGPNLDILTRRHGGPASFVLNAIELGFARAATATCRPGSTRGSRPRTSRSLLRRRRPQVTLTTGNCARARALAGLEHAYAGRRSMVVEPCERVQRFRRFQLDSPPVLDERCDENLVRTDEARLERMRQNAVSLQNVSCKHKVKLDERRRP